MSDPVLDPVLAAMSTVKPDASIIAEFQNSEWDDVVSPVKIIDVFIHLSDAQKVKTWCRLMGIVSNYLISHEEGRRRLVLLCAKPYSITAHIITSLKALKCTEGADTATV